MKRGISIFILISLVCTVSTYASWNDELIPPSAGEENMIKNGGFEDVGTNGIPSYWNGGGWTNPAMGDLSVCTTGAASGSSCVKMTKASSVTAAIFAQGVGAFIKGARYQVHAMIKSDITVNGINFKFEFTNVSGAGVSYLYTDKAQNTEGQWVQYACTFTAPVTAGGASFIPLVRTNGTVYLDDVKLYKVAEPSKISLESDQVFYYSDRTENGVATVTLDERFEYYNDGSLLFSINEAGTYTCGFTGNTARWSFPMSLLSEKKKQYVLKVVFKDKNGAVLETHTQNVYKYDRPKMLDSRGRLIVDGAEFTIVKLSDVRLENYENAKPYLDEAGINTLSCPASCLDACLEIGMKAIVPLYPNMKSPVNPDNIAGTIEILEKYSDHPALLAWNVLDEPYLNAVDPSGELEESYRLIREYDTVHPIYMNEAPNKEHIKSSVKYGDMVGTDPYPISPYNPAQYIYDNISYISELEGGNKPVFAYLDTFFWQGYFPTPDELRSGIYQSLWAGSSQLGYYCASPYTSGEAPYLWETELWNGLLEFHNNEQEGAFGHFIYKAYPPFCDSMGEEAWYRGYVKDEELFIAVLNTDNTPKTVHIPLISYNSQVSINGFSAQVVAGAESTALAGSANTLTVSLSGNGVVLCKVTPQSETDFSSLSWLEFSGGTITDGTIPERTEKPVPENYVENGDMENVADGMPCGITKTGTSGTVEAMAEEAYSGSYSLKISGSGGVTFETGKMHLPAGTYKLSFMMKGGKVTVILPKQAISLSDGFTTGADAGTWKVFPNPLGLYHIAPFKYNDGWQEQILYFTIKEGYGCLRFYASDACLTGAWGMNAYIDDLKISRASLTAEFYKVHSFSGTSGESAYTEYAYEKVGNGQIASGEKLMLRCHIPDLAESVYILTGYYKNQNGVPRLLGMATQSFSGGMANDILSGMTVPEGTNLVKGFIWKKGAELEPYCNKIELNR